MFRDDRAHLAIGLPVRVDEAPPVLACLSEMACDGAATDRDTGSSAIREIPHLGRHRCDRPRAAAFDEPLAAFGRQRCAAVAHFSATGSSPRSAKTFFAVNVALSARGNPQYTAE